MAALSDVKDFGAIDADSDALLREAFQDHPAYQDGRSHRRFLITGRKGSGKTAIFKKLITERSYSTFSFGHTFEDYPWHYHDLQAEIGVPEEHRYTHSWKYLILLSLGKLLLNQDQSQPWSEDSFESLRRLEDFVVDSYGSRDPDLTQLFIPGKELHLKGVLRTPVIEVTGERLMVSSLPKHVQEVNRAVTADVLECLNPANDYFVCFDQLDLGFDPVNPKYAQRLIGLILAARELTQAAREATKRMSVLVFLREDIYELLQFEDKNKITDNYLSSISWDESEGEFTLASLMEKRFRVTLNETTLQWSDVFDEEKQMPSRQTKYAHICDRTFLRPRDIIKFCNEILESHKDRDPQDNQFRNEDIHSARDGYSEYLLRELDDEIHKHLPEYREYLELLKIIGTTDFSRGTFEEAWNARPSLANSQMNPTQVLRDLFEFSVIGYLKPGGRGGGSKYVWRYLDPRARFTEESEVYRVHAGFKEALDLVKRSARQDTIGRI